MLLFKATGSIIEFVGKISFTNNNAEGFDGGSLYLLTSQIILNTGAHLEFVNNTGWYDNYIWHGATVVIITGWVLQ